jgi:hypothetical protein
MNFQPWSAMPPPLPPRPVAANGSYRRRCLPDRPPTAEVETMDCDDYGGCNAGGGGENRDLLELSPLAQPPPVTAATTATTNLPSLPHPDVTATGEELPPEMEEATQKWVRTNGVGLNEEHAFNFGDIFEFAF